MGNDAGIRIGIDWEPGAADLHRTIGSSDCGKRADAHRHIMLTSTFQVTRHFCLIVPCILVDFWTRVTTISKMHGTRSGLIRVALRLYLL
jgi:hypothetical protein